MYFIIMIMNLYVNDACQDDGRLPLPCVPWPVWLPSDQRQAEADKLIEELEKKTGPLSDNVLKAGLLKDSILHNFNIS